MIAKFHYTDTDTDFFAAKLRWVRASPFRRKKVRVRVRVVELSVNEAWLRALCVSYCDACNSALCCVVYPTEYSADRDADNNTVNKSAVYAFSRAVCD